PLEIELRDRREDLEIVGSELVDDLEEAALAVEEFEEIIDLVGDLGEAIEQLVFMDLKYAVERRELLEESPPLVHAAHAFHEDALYARLDRHLIDADGPEFEIEASLTPDEEAIDGLFPAEFAEFGVLQCAVLEVDGTAATARGEKKNAGFAADVDRLEEIDEAHVGQRTAEARF